MVINTFHEFIKYAHICNNKQKRVSQHKTERLENVFVYTVADI